RPPWARRRGRRTRHAVFQGSLPLAPDGTRGGFSTPGHECKVKECDEEGDMGKRGEKAWRVSAPRWRGFRTAGLPLLVAAVTLTLPSVGLAQARVGAWVDAVIAVQEPSDAAAVSRLEANDFQAWFSATSNPDLRDRVARNPALTSVVSFGLQSELTFNPVGPVFGGTNRLNPFASPKIREAMNWLINGRFIAQGIMLGMATPRYLPIAGALPDYAWRADAARGQWHLYTGGWQIVVIVRDESGNFDFFCTPRGLTGPLWQAYKPSPEFDHVSDQLARSDYTTIAERNRLFTRALELAMQDSARIWLVDRTSIWPRRAEVKVVADLAGGISGSLLWPYTIRYEGRTGGTVRIGVPNMLPEPWNPIGGSNFIFDTTLYRATQDYATVVDPYTGLDVPQRVERAEVFVKRGLPV